MEDLVGVITKRVIVQVVVKSLLMESSKDVYHGAKKFVQKHRPIHKTARFVKEIVKKSSEPERVQLSLFE